MPMLRNMHDEEPLKNVAWSMVYVAEAHADDEWPIASGRYNLGRGPVHVLQTRHTDARVQAARNFAKDFGVDSWCRILADPLPNDGETSDGPFDRLYAPWPLRFYVMRGNRLEYISNPSSCSYDLAELRRAVYKSESVPLSDGA
jgi:hypothetical protein